MNQKTTATYPEGCNQAIKEFVDKTNKVLSKYNGFILDEYYLGQNNTYNLIYKIVLPDYLIISVECLDVEETDERMSDHYEAVKVVKYDEMLDPISSITVAFDDIESIQKAIDSMNKIIY